jgi:hypothetical protein
LLTLSEWFSKIKGCCKVENIQRVSLRYEIREICQKIDLVRKSEREVGNNAFHTWRTFNFVTVLALFSPEFVEYTNNNTFFFT